MRRGSGNRCNRLRMLEPRTGRAGWHKVLTGTGSAGIVVTPSGVNGSDSEHEARTLSFAPAKPCGVSP
ncbi:hypothetical protein ACFXJ6_02355 [Streptomyces sp. NPDC059218]|uniref:hypothetical protein n=1 Tax=unclassified Streptomyces TaxID=2593676 RepID=UPI00369360A4